jgi:carbonic anhydrase
MIATASRALDTLMDGNERFRSGSGTLHRYTLSELSQLAEVQSPIAAILACSDSRVAPEVVFDQPLGSVFAARTPGNVSADSVKWMIDIAVEDLGVPLFLVVGHTGCLAVTQIVQGELTGPGGALRAQINSALMKAKSANTADLMRATIEENVYQTIDRLSNESYELRKAVMEEKTTVVGAVYDMHTGEVRVLPQR